MTDPRKLDELSAIVDRLSYVSHPTFGSYEADVLDALCRLVHEAETPDDAIILADGLLAAATALRDQKDRELDT